MAVRGEETMNMISRLSMALAAFALIAPVSDIAPSNDGVAVAKKRSSKSSRRRTRGYTPMNFRGATSGECPCNGGKVCVGPRGGRYCITSSGNKRYGV